MAVYLQYYYYCVLTKQVPAFENCSCVAENLSKFKTFADQHAVLTGAHIGNSTAINGKCQINCHNLGIFLFCVALLVFFIFILKIPTILVTIRYFSVSFVRCLELQSCGYLDPLLQYSADQWSVLIIGIGR